MDKTITNNQFSLAFLNDSDPFCNSKVFLEECPVVLTTFVIAVKKAIMAAASTSPSSVNFSLTRPPKDFTMLSSKDIFAAF